MADVLGRFSMPVISGELARMDYLLVLLLRVDRIYAGLSIP